MKASFRLGWFTVFFLFSAAALFAAPANLIVNGNFANDSGWNNLGQYDGGQGTGKIENNSYVIGISSAGSVPWSIQFTQNRIVLDSGHVYLFSYDITSSIERTVEVSLSRNGGDYASFSGRDTIPVSSILYHSEKKFVMKNPTDQDVRLEFNCGKATGTITLQNIKLVEFTEPSLSVGSPQSGEQLIGGVPYSIVWSALNVGATVRIDLSADNGATWKTIGTAPADSGKFYWVPGMPYSPWCRIRVSSVSDTGIAALNGGPFECLPGRELVANSRFNFSAKEWILGAYGSGKATGRMHKDSAFLIRIEKSGEDFWQIQLTQNGISLVKGQTYLLSLTAAAVSSADIKINIGMDREPFTSYFDTTKWILSLSRSPRRYTIAFTMNQPSDSSARIEFNCGKSSGDIFIDEISVVPDYVAPVISAGRFARQEAVVHWTGVLVGAPGIANTHFGTSTPGRTVRVLDLQGRAVGGVRYREEGNTTRATVQQGAPGLYIMGTNRRRDK